MARPQQLAFDATPPVEAATLDASLARVGGRLPERLFMGTSSWTFPGWQGLVYSGQHNEKVLARDGLRAYAQHPLLRTVGIDRTHYGPVDGATFATWAHQVPRSFRFLVKAHEACTLTRYPFHPRYGKLAGQDNGRFLDSGYARDVVVAPMVEGLGAHAGPLLFQFAPQDVAAMGGAKNFARRLHAFLAALPPGPLYAVEVRNPELLTPAYGEALVAHGAVHCFNLWGTMPPLREQARILRRVRFRALVLRWLLRPSMGYDEAVARYKPFNRLMDEDPAQRGAIAWLARFALGAGHEVFIIVNNKAEGSAPLSIGKLAEALLPT